MLSPMPLPGPRLPRVPLVPDPLRRVDVPRDLAPLVHRAEHEEDPAAVGMTREGVEAIWEGVERLYRHGVHPAIGLCVRRRGRVVLDRSIGWARGGEPGSTVPEAERVPATPDVPYCIFSASKAITATVVHLLDERGALHIGDRVAEYVPEFAGRGKHRITIDHVLSHRAGIPNIRREAIDLDRIGDRAFLLGELTDAMVRTRPGSRLAYHAVSGGFVLGEIVHRVTGKDIRRVLQEELLDPLGFRWTNYGVGEEDLDAVGLAAPTGPPALPPVSTVLERALGLPVDEVTRISNDPRFLRAIVPAGNVVSTADELSRFFDLLRAGGTLDGTRILDARTIRRALIERSHHEVDLSLVAPLRHASGYMLGARQLSLYGPDTEMAFGHLGFTNVLGWADPRRELAVGLITSGKPALATHLPALRALTQRIGRAAPKVDHPRLLSA